MQFKLQPIIKHLLCLILKGYKFAKARPKITSIFVLVLIWHIAVFQLFGIKLPKSSKVVSAPKPIAVQTIKLNPPKPKPTPPKPAPKKEKKKTEEKKQESKKPKKEKKKEKPPEPKEEKVSEKTQELLDNLSKTLEKITERNEKDLELPKIQTITPLSEITESKEDINPSFEFNAADPADLWYREELIKRLKLYLKLPELEIVQVRLTIYKNGSVSSIKIVESKSKKNENYVLNKIPEIPFPKFGAQMSKHEYRIFPLILESEG